MCLSQVQFCIVTRRVFLAGFETQLLPREIPRNKLWREFVPLVRDSSLRLTALQDYMVAHQKETSLATVDRTFLSNLDCCIDDLQAMTHKLKILKELLKKGG
jgi:hypothetical protein